MGHASARLHCISAGRSSHLASIGCIDLFAVCGINRSYALAAPSKRGVNGDGRERVHRDAEFRLVVEDGFVRLWIDALEDNLRNASGAQKNHLFNMERLTARRPLADHEHAAGLHRRGIAEWTIVRSASDEIIKHVRHR